VSPGRGGAPAAFALALALALAAVAASRLIAQDTTVAATGADSISAAARERDARAIPLPVTETPAGPLAPGSRIVFTRDSLLWTRGYTVADLLGEVPGVYVARSGFIGQPAPVMYAGRGITALEILWDGVPMVPIGPDSVAVDPGRISLFPFERIEVEVLPGRLRVYLVSERHEAISTRSLVRVVSGDFNTGAYAGLFQKRWANGVGINLAADFFGSEGAQDPRRDATWFDLWGKAEWAPTASTAATFEVRRQTYTRDSTGVEDLLVPERRGRRTDAIVRLTSAQRGGRHGFWTHAGLVTTRWSPDSLSPDSLVDARTYRRVFLGFGYTDRRANAEITGRLGDHFTRNGFDARAGWTPLTFLSLAADWMWERHAGGGTSRRAHAMVSLYRGPFSLAGEVADDAAVAAPILTTDSTQRTNDRAVRAGVSSRRVAGHLSLVDRARFAPLRFTEFPAIADLGATPRARWIVADLTLRAGPWALRGWYSHPTGGTLVDFQPPNHARAEITLRSKFFRTFRSGAFEFKFQFAMESWSTGLAGRDANGAPIPLVGATFYDGFLQLEIARFRLFYGMANLYRSREHFVPGHEVPRTAQTFGVRWTFEN